MLVQAKLDLLQSMRLQVSARSQMSTAMQLACCEKYLKADSQSGHAISERSKH